MKKYFLFLIPLIVLSCESDGNSAALQSDSNTGQGGSLARFVIKDNYLYTVDNEDLNVFSIINPQEPVQVNTVPIGFDIETLFNYRDYLYVGSRNGMFIYGTSDPEAPNQLSAVQHFTACDPVVANDSHAFVTLHANIGCGTDVNILEIYDIADITNPVLVSSRNLTRPIGLGLYHNYLFVCDDEVKIFDVSDPENAVLVNSIDRNTFDVIIQGNLLVLIGDEGLYQYSLDQTDIQNINSLSVIPI